MTASIRGISYGYFSSMFFLLCACVMAAIQQTQCTDTTIRSNFYIYAFLVVIAYIAQLLVTYLLASNDEAPICTVGVAPVVSTCLSLVMVLSGGLRSHHWNFPVIYLSAALQVCAYAFVMYKV